MASKILTLFLVFVVKCDEGKNRKNQPLKLSEIIFYSKFTIKGEARTGKLALWRRNRVIEEVVFTHDTFSSISRNTTSAFCTESFVVTKYISSSSSSRWMICSFSVNEINSFWVWFASVIFVQFNTFHIDFHKSSGMVNCYVDNYNFFDKSKLIGLVQIQLIWCKHLLGRVCI